VAVLCTCRVGFADQRRDWMLDLQQPQGTFLYVDAVIPGVQLMLEHRIPIYDWFNEVDLRVNSLLMVPYYESKLDLDVRILVATFGASVGYMNTFLGQSFRPDESMTAEHRRDREYKGDIEDESWGFVEGRVAFSIPLNDYLFVQNVNTLRAEDRPDRSFDWHTGVVHDGLLFRSDFMPFIKNKEIGAFAPMLQVLNFNLDDTRHTILNYGFTFLTRPGFQRRDDMFLLSILVYGATLGKRMNMEDIYGFHTLYLPLTFSCYYRAVVDLDFLMGD
jgi:hypothetical protein